ncbi:MAG: iron-containing alcohol dehydrogenase [Acidobacteriota bacterium]
MTLTVPSATSAPPDHPSASHSGSPAASGLDAAGHSWDLDLGGIRVVFDAGALARLGELASQLDGRRPLVVTDPGILAAGHVGRAVSELETAGLSPAVFDGAAENPTTEDVARGVEAAAAHRADMLIGLGGGSSMDCAKGINFLYTNGGRMEDYWGVGKATRPMLPSLGVPTTAGTGSEAQRFALISQAESHRKMACGDVKARFRTVILDPELLTTVPRDIAAVTGVDALSHAVESYVTRRRNPISQLFARESWRLIERSFEPSLNEPGDEAARRDMLLGAHLAGAAIEASMLGAAHSCANPLTARYGIVHGSAVGVMLPHVVRFNGHEVDHLYQDLVRVAGLNGAQHASDSERLSHRLADLLGASQMPTRLEDYGVDRARLPQLAVEAAEQWTAQFNPRAVAASDLEGLYAAAF